MRDVEEALRNDEVVGIFPEGTLTRDGELSKFRRGIEHIAARTPVPVIPLILRGLREAYSAEPAGDSSGSFRRGCGPHRGSTRNRDLSGESLCRFGAARRLDRGREQRGLDIRFQGSL
jgi:hypothetical protein